MFHPVFSALVLSACSSAPEVSPDVQEDTSTSDTGTDSGTVVVGPTCEELPELAEQLLGSRCAACHGPASPAYGGFGDALDPEALVEEGWVTPGNPGNSPILTSILADEMPPSNGGGPLSAAERTVIEQWIDCGAESWGEVASSRGFLSPEMEFQAALDDARDLGADNDGDDPDGENARYLSLVPLYNAGVDADRIELYATALSKLVLSLTVEFTTAPLIPVDLDGFELDDGTPIRVADGLGRSLLFRVDLKTFGWDNPDEAIDVWEELVKLYPFGVQYDNEFEAAEELVDLTHSRIPLVHGDWFAANASLPPLYFDVLDMPATFDGFMEQFGDIQSVQEDFDLNRVACAGMDASQSLVSGANRVICRHDARPGYCWESFDFASIAGNKNIFTDPVDFLVAKDGGEAFCSLPSGQQVYLVYNAAGERIDNAPIAVVSDYNDDAGGEVKTGLSCIRCHEEGVLERDDQVRDILLANPNNFDEAVFDLALEWYRPNDELAEIYAQDIDDFSDALDTIEVPVGLEVTWELSEEYEAPMSAVRVAAELGLAEGAFLARLETDDDIQLLYSSLYGGLDTLERDAFEFAARDTICELEVGDVCDEAAFCGLSAVPCPAGSSCDAQGQCTKVE